MNQAILRPYFNKLPHYDRFVVLMQRVSPVLECMIQWLCLQTRSQGIAYVDSTSLKVCNNKRTSKHKVFREVAALSKTTKGWFYGLKLHIVINSKGDIMNFIFTAGNVDDREVVPAMTQRLTGLIFGDKGYMGSKLFAALYDRGLKLVTGIRSNMKNKLMSAREKLLLKKRSVVESVFNVLKFRYNLEYTGHRSLIGASVHMMVVLLAYMLQHNKPHINP